MARKKAFFKVSGDSFDHPDFLELVREVAKEYFVVICVGGGKQINDAFRAEGLEAGDHGPLGRETKNSKERQIARNVLEANKERLEDLLAEKGITAAVEIPFLNLGSVLCPFNGDLAVMLAYIGFEVLYVITTNERLEKKRQQFAHLPKVEVAGLAAEEA